MAHFKTNLPFPPQRKLGYKHLYNNTPSTNQNLAFEQGQGTFLPHFFFSEIPWLKRLGGSQRASHRTWRISHGPWQPSSGMMRFWPGTPGEISLQKQFWVEKKCVCFCVTDFCWFSSENGCLKQTKTQMEGSCWKTTWVFPKIVGKPPNSSHLFIGFSMKFLPSILGGKLKAPYFWFNTQELQFQYGDTIYIYI